MIPRTVPCHPKPGPVLIGKAGIPTCSCRCSATTISVTPAPCDRGAPRPQRAIDRLWQRRPQPQPHGEGFERPVGALSSFGSKIDYLDVKPAVATCGLILEKYNYQDSGYLRISVDAQQLRIGFHVAQYRLAPAITL